MIGTGTAVQPTASNHRPGDPRRVGDGGRNIAEQCRGIGVSRMGNDLDALFAEQHGEGAPVRAVRQAGHLLMLAQQAAEAVDWRVDARQPQ